MSLDLFYKSNGTSGVKNTGSDDITKLSQQEENLYNKAYKEQQNIINTSTQQTVDSINRNKEKLNEETDKQSRALYTDYAKQVNPYGVTAEELAINGLANSGVSESTQTNLYNSYQKSRTDVLNTAKSLLADYDAQITQARQNGDIQLAQAALDMYNQRIENLYRTYQLSQNEKQFEYQKSRDAVADNQWQQQYDYNKSVNDRNYNYQVSRDKVSDSQWDKQYSYNKSVDDRNYNYQVNRDKVSDNQWQQQYDYNKSVDDRNYDYQVNRDKVTDSQWEKEYDLQKKKLNKSSRSSYSKRYYSSGSNNSSGSNTYTVASDDNSVDSPKKEYTIDEVKKNIGIVQGPGIVNNVIDKISGKTFSSIEEVLNYYGFGAVE